MAKEKKTDFDQLVSKHGAITGIELQEFEASLPVLSTGIFSLDMALGAVCPFTGCGGIRNRDLVEVMGLPGSGKTALLSSMIRTTQQRYPGKGSVVVLFTEPPDTKRMIREGINIEWLVMLGCYAGNRVKLAPDLLDAVVEFAANDKVKFTGIDSVPMLLTESEREKDLSESQNVAGLARVFNPFVKKYIDNVVHAPLMYLNHYREPLQIGFSSAPPSILNPTTAGGKTKDFMSRARIMATSSPLWRKDGAERVMHSETGKPIQDGLEIVYALRRNKYMNLDGNRPVQVKLTFADSRFNTEEVTLVYADHFTTRDETSGELRSILKPPTLQKGAWYYIGDKKCQGLKQAIAYLRENPDVLTALQSQIMPRSQEFFADNKSFNVESILEGV